MMEMYGMMSFVTTLMVPYLLAFILLPVILYVVARWRQEKSGLTDPHLGLKAALAYFRVAAFQVCLAGAWMFLYALIHKGESGDLFRSAFGLLISGGLILAAQQAALQRTNYRALPMPVRLFDGMNLIQTGVIGFASLVFACVVSLQKDVEGDLLRVAWTLAVVYAGTWAAILSVFLSRLEGGSSMRAAVDPNDIVIPRG